MSHTVLNHTPQQGVDGTNNHYVVPLGQDRLLILQVASQNGAESFITGITWGGQSMTNGVSVTTTAAGTKLRVEQWYLDDAGIQAAGDQNGALQDAGIQSQGNGGGLPFIITWSAGTPASIVSSAGSYEFVDQITPIDNTVAVESSTVPIDNPIGDIIVAQAGSLTVAAVACGESGDQYYWYEYWNERYDESDGTITLGVADRIISTLSPELVSVEYQSAITTRQALAALEMHPSADTPPEIQLDSRSGGAVNSGTVVEFDIIIRDRPNKFLVISPAYEFGIDETGYTSLVQVNGEDAVFVASETAGCLPPAPCVGIHNTSDMYYVVDPQDGTNTIRVECTMVAGVEPRDMMVSAACLFNVGPPDILSVLTDKDDEPLPTILGVNHPTEDLTGNSIIIDSLVMGNPLPAMTGHSNQIKIADQQGVGSLSSRSTLAFKYSDATPLGVSIWSQGSQIGQPGLRAAMVSMAIDSFSDSTAPSFICTDTTVEDITIEPCEDRNLFRMNVSNSGDDVDMFFEFDTCTLQILNIQTIGSSSRDIRFEYNGTPTDFTPNEIVDVSSLNIYFTPVGPYYLPTLVLEGEYSITFI